MATIRPFRALRPLAEHAQQVSCVPYDVVTKSEARTFIEGNPLSFLRVTRPKSAFPKGSKPAIEEVFERARQNLEEFVDKGILEADPNRAYYVYQLTSDEHTQTGLVACLPLDEYEQGVIKKHEKVRPDKVEERTGHLRALRAQTGLILLTFRNTDDVEELLEEAVSARAIYDFVCPDGIRQRVWRIENMSPWTEAFRYVPSIYIADGHHRIESALRARDVLRQGNPEHRGDESYNFVMAGLFPAEQLRILPYNRVIRDLNGLDTETFFDKLRDHFIVVDTLEKTPTRQGVISMYIDGAWWKLRFNPQDRGKGDPVKDLDVSILQDRVLGPILGIHNVTTDERIAFVGGKRGTAELERLVDAGDAKVAFSLYPTSIDDMLTVSDMDDVMPPKSTWFDPKLKDGLLVHRI